MTAQSDESAIVIVVPTVEALVGEIRARYDRSAARGMPAHITLLYPFADATRISPDVHAQLRALFRRHSRFSFALTGVCGFRGVAYLNPQPHASFDALTHDLVRSFPEYLPYGGTIADPMPHLTLAQSPPATLLDVITRQIVDEIGIQLPMHCQAEEVTLAIKRAGRWSMGACFRLGDAGDPMPGGG
jgi:2'-5' RNA ligase